MSEGEDGGLSAFEEYRRLVGELPGGTEGSVELIAQQLSAPAEQLLRLASIPHSFNDAVVGILVPDLDEPTRQAAMVELNSLSFVITVSDGFVLHDEVRAYLFGQWLKEHERRSEKWARFLSVSGLLADYYKVRVEAAIGESRTVAERHRIFHLVGSDPKKGFAAFEKLCRAERYRFHLDSCEALINLVREYNSVLSPEDLGWLNYHEAKLEMDLRHYEDASKKFSQLLEWESVRENPALQARCLRRLANTLKELRDFPRARITFQRLKEFAADEPAAADQELSAMQGMAALLMDMGELENADQILREAVMLAEDGGNDGEIATVWNTIGILRRRLSQPQRALEAFQTALSHLERAGEVYRPRQVYNNIGLLHADRADWATARENLERSYEIARQAGDMDGEATALINLSRVYLSLEQPGEALAAINRADELFQTIHNWHSAAVTKQSLARYYRRVRRKQEARAAFVEAEHLFKRAGAEDEANRSRADADGLDNLREGWGAGKWFLIVLAGFVAVFGLIFLMIEAMD